MKRMYKMLVLAVLCALTAVLCGCSAQDITLPAALDLFPGQSYALGGAARLQGEPLDTADVAQLVASTAALENFSIDFTSSNPAVVTVDNAGVLSAQTPGDATVTVRCDALGYAAQVAVQVVSAPAAIAITPAAQLRPGDVFVPETTVLPWDGTVQLAYQSSDPAVAVVDAQGAVTAVAQGEAVITAAVPGTSLAAACTVTVGDAVQSIALTRAAATLAAGQRLVLGAQLNPGAAAAVQWSSSDESVATVTPGGEVTAVGAGIAGISATAGGKTAVCTVTVQAPATYETATPETATPESATPESATPESATPESATPQPDERSLTMAEAEQTPAAAPSAMRQTAPGPVLATPETAAPEQLVAEEGTLSVWPDPSRPPAMPPEVTSEWATPETATPESATPESATPESATPESATPETATPESTTPESATPETATPAPLRTWLDDAADTIGRIANDAGEALNGIFRRILGR